MASVRRTGRAVLAGRLERREERRRGYVKYMYEFKTKTKADLETTETF